MNLLAAELVSARFAHEPRPAIDLSAARTALGGFAVPSAGEVVREVRLDVMDGVEDDHAFQRGPLGALLPGARRCLRGRPGGRSGCRTPHPGPPQWEISCSCPDRLRLGWPWRWRLGRWWGGAASANSVPRSGGISSIGR